MSTFNEDRLRVGQKLLEQIEKAAQDQTSPYRLAQLSEAYGLVLGTVTSTTHIEAKGS